MIFINLFHMLGITSYSGGTISSPASDARRCITKDWTYIRTTILSFKKLTADDVSCSVHSSAFRWGDGTSRNDVSPYKCSGTPGPQINRPMWRNVPGSIHPCHYALCTTFRLVKNDRDISMRGHCVSGTIHLGDQGSQNIRTGTHRFGTSRHPPSFYFYIMDPSFDMGPPQPQMRAWMGHKPSFKGFLRRNPGMSFCPILTC